jgi:hypothetical protein
MKKVFFCILKVTEERSRIQIRTKMSRIPNTGFFQAGRSSSRLGAAAAANLTTSCAWLIFTGIDAGIKIVEPNTMKCLITFFGLSGSGIP